MDIVDTHLRVLYSFEYETKSGRRVSITEGEKLFLIKRTNNDWWQVIRNSTERPFFVPVSYVEVIKQVNESSDSKFVNTPKSTVNEASGTKYKTLHDEKFNTHKSDSETNKNSLLNKVKSKIEREYYNLSEINKRIESEKWRQWAAEELISELSQKKESYSRQPLCIASSSDESLDKEVRQYGCFLSVTDKIAEHEHTYDVQSERANWDSLVELPGYTRKGLGENLSSESQQNLHNHNHPSSSKHQAHREDKLLYKNEKSLINPNLTGGGDKFKGEDSIVYKKKIFTQDYIQKENYNFLNKNNCVSDISIQSEGDKKLPEVISTNDCLEDTPVASVERPCRNIETVSVLDTYDLPQIKTDMLSKLKTKLKYSTSFKTRKELEKRQTRYDKTCVLSSSWDKLEALPGGSTQDSSISHLYGHNTGREISELYKNESDLTSSVKIETGAKQNEDSSSASECDYNANYNLDSTEKSGNIVNQSPLHANLVVGLQSSAHTLHDDDDFSDSSVSNKSEDTLEKQYGINTNICSASKSQGKIGLQDKPTDDTSYHFLENASNCSNLSKDNYVDEIPLPIGWCKSFDEKYQQMCYINSATNAKWFSSHDSEGRVYFYEADSTESSWRLPDLPKIVCEAPVLQVSEPNEIFKEKEKKLSLTVSSDDSQIRHQSEDRPTFRITKARSMVFSDAKHKEGLNKSSSFPRNRTDVLEPSLEIIKEGVLNRTKITENNKKVRKNWSTAYVVLTQTQLLFFKDSKTYQAWKNRAAVLYDIKIQLTESFIHKGDNLSSRKNVFVLNNTRQGLRVLVQSDDAQQMKEWYQAVMKASDMSVPKETKYVSSNFLSPEVTLRNQHLPEDSKTSHRIERVRSVKSKTKEGSLEDLPSSPEEQQVKIHRRLKNFFMRRPLKESLEQRGILKNEGVFGCLLEDVCLNEEDCIPQFVKKCVDAIESKEENMKAVGLYRASGNLSQVQKIRHQVNQENYKVLEEEDDVHVLTGSLKLFFRELKEPLIPFEFYKTLTNHDLCVDVAARQTDEEKLSQFLDIVKRLPEANHNTLQFLLRHLLKITEYKEYNQMTLHTLSIVFGPSLMWPEEESQQQQNMAMELLVVQNFVVESLLKMYSKIFAN